VRSGFAIAAPIGTPVSGTQFVILDECETWWRVYTGGHLV
jgi:hypothetical protein